MNSFNKNSVHFLFAAVIIFFGGLPVLSGGTPIDGNLLFTSLLVIFMCAIVFYFYYLFLIPKFFFANRIRLFWLISIAFTIIFPLIWISFFHFMWKITGNAHLKGGTVWLSMFLYIILFMMFSGFFRFMLEWFKDYKKKQELEKQNIISELALLRSQINPHFLFNTLNNIHTFAYIDVDKTAYSIEKLSDIMRYMLYESDAEKVLLEKEINYIKSYIELINIKFKERDYVHFEISGELTGKFIAPMIFIPFVENAFKHGKKKTQHPGIEIVLDVKSDNLSFSVSNNLPQNINEESENGGIGLANIKRRLELLYPEKHKLEITETKEKFVTNLIISLS